MTSVTIVSAEVILGCSSGSVVSGEVRFTIDPSSALLSAWCTATEAYPVPSTRLGVSSAVCYANMEEPCIDLRFSSICCFSSVS